MSQQPVAPRRTGDADSGVSHAPAASRLAAAPAPSASHYSSTRRHSLYGTEDRVVLDPGSLVWKIGFSGESRPRDVLYAGSKLTAAVCKSFDMAGTQTERDEDERMLQVLLQDRLRAMFFESLITDPKSRKIIVIEHPLMPLSVKETIARILFNNLQVPSLSFVSSHLLALLACGRISGLVVDCGHFESTALPIFSSRPLYSYLRTTPIAGKRYSDILRSLIRLHGTWIPPPVTLGGPTGVPASTRATNVPQEVLSDEFLEQVKTRICFVGDPVNHVPTIDKRNDPMAVDDEEEPASELSRHGSLPPSSSPPIPSSDLPETPTALPARSNTRRVSAKVRVPSWEERFAYHSTTTHMTLKAIPPRSERHGTGRGSVFIPGWIRERAAEIFFDRGDEDESSIAGIILDSLLKTPVDLRRLMASSIVICGGTAMLPGFISRLHKEILRRLEPPTPTSPATSLPLKHARRPVYDPYGSLRPLVPFISILNDTSPPSDNARAGKAPAFAPAILPWLGGSLAGALKTGGEEITREQWDEADVEKEDIVDEAEPETQQATERVRQGGSVLPDWTRTQMPIGAPSVFHHSPSVSVA